MKKLFLALFMMCASIVADAQTYSRYDVNRDGTVSVADLSVLASYILGNINYPVTDITLSKASATLFIGDTLQLSATVLPVDADDPSVTWVSDDISIATVIDGMILAVGEGNANITCKANDGSGVIATCMVAVSKKSDCGVHEYVDLGLSVKWATCNVGASKPEEYGDYFAWGETTGCDSGKTYFDWSTYKWCKGPSLTLTKYCTSSLDGIVDNKIILDSDDDAAHVNWGGAWRMPTKEEQAELCNNCTWIWITLNGVYGRKVTGPNGNSIFLPAAGYRYDSSLYSVGSDGYYWSSSLGATDSCYAYFINFYSGYVYWYASRRYSGCSVRPVCP